MSIQTHSLASPFCHLCFGIRRLCVYPLVLVITRRTKGRPYYQQGGGPDRTVLVLIQKGSTVGYFVYAIDRRSDLYGIGMDAELFRPERWDEYMPVRRDKTNATWGYFPFNGGPRTCFGRKLQVNLKNCGILTSPPVDSALIEAAYTVVRLLHQFPTSIEESEGFMIFFTGKSCQNTFLRVMQIATLLNRSIPMSALSSFIISSYSPLDSMTYVAHCRGHCQLGGGTPMNQC